MEGPKLGQLVEGVAHRDAVHVAVAPVEAAEHLCPGQEVGLVGGKACWSAEVMVGVVDPFLKVPVKPGERFWLCLPPLSVTSLRHAWTHAAFKAQLPAKEVALDA